MAEFPTFNRAVVGSTPTGLTIKESTFMLFIERFIILICAGTFVVTTILVMYKLFQAADAKQRAQAALEKALSSNSKKQLENVLIAYDSSLDKNTKEKLRIRIDEMIIEEDDSNFQTSKDSAL